MIKILMVYQALDPIIKIKTHSTFDKLSNDPNNI